MGLMILSPSYNHTLKNNNNKINIIITVTIINNITLVQIRLVADFITNHGNLYRPMSISLYKLMFLDDTSFIGNPGYNHVPWLIG